MSSLQLRDVVPEKRAARMFLDWNTAKMNYLVISTVTVVLAGPMIAASEVFKCVDADGRVLFSDTSCPSGEVVQIIQASGGLTATKADGLTNDERQTLQQAETRAAAILIQRERAINL